ncbi:hypothetical protein DFH06DRAFT_910303, partial [Mycena polygramma]
DSEIHALQEVLSRLVSERNALRDYSAECRGLFSPIRRLPSEILVEIFALCRPHRVYVFDIREDWPEDAAQRVAQTHLLHLSRVCYGWHGTVMGTPTLW